jgi:hypothetical protein
VGVPQCLGVDVQRHAMQRYYAPEQGIVLWGATGCSDGGCGVAG